jgi:hypothetical protein
MSLEQRCIAACTEGPSSASMATSPPRTLTTANTAMPDHDVDAALACTRCGMALAGLLGVRALADLQDRRASAEAAAAAAREVLGVYDGAEARLCAVRPHTHALAAELALARARFLRDVAGALVLASGVGPTVEELRGVCAAYTAARRLLLDVQAACVPPRSASIATPSAAAAAAAAGPPLLPAARALAQASAEAAVVEAQLARLTRQHASLAVQAAERRAIADPAQRWLLDTVPPAEPTPDTLGVRAVEAVALRGAVPVCAGGKATAAATASLGAGLLLLASREGALDAAWGQAIPEAGEGEGKGTGRADREDMALTDLKAQAEMKLKQAVEEVGCASWEFWLAHWVPVAYGA